jgi:hypothetical protein
MIFPQDYKSVGIKDNERPGDPIYFATHYLISRQGPKLYQVISSGQGFMREVESLELISSGPQIMEFPKVVDTRNRTLLIELASELCTKEVETVIFKGIDEHITFVHQPDPSQILTIEILDVSPPDPPWLIHVIDRLEHCGVLGDLTVKFQQRVLDLRKFADDGVYYPCRASGLGRSLDSDRVVHSRPKIVGCEISREIFLATCPGREHEFVNICPTQSLEPKGPFITRCCRSERKGLIRKEGHLGVLVHWGDGAYEILEAIRRLVKALRE